MYTCTHFPKTIQQRHFKQPAPFIHSSASQAHSLHLSVIGEWYLGFWPTHHFTQEQVSQPQARFPSWAGGGHCDMICVKSLIYSLHKDLSLYNMHTSNKGVDTNHTLGSN